MADAAELPALPRGVGDGPHPSETNSNFGFNLPWWGHLLGTYRPQPRDDHERMTLGIEQFRTCRDLWLDRMLVQPLIGPASGYAINREDLDDA